MTKRMFNDLMHELKAKLYPVQARSDPDQLHYAKSKTETMPGHLRQWSGITQEDLRETVARL